MSTSKKKVSKKSAYTKQSEVRLDETKSKLNRLKVRIDNAVSEGRADLSKQLKKAELQLQTQFATVERRLDRLKDSGEESWNDLKSSLDTAWEDLTQSIRNIVKKLS